jgi:hypothetical protein
MRAFFTAHPEFRVDDDFVTSAVDIDYREILGDVEQIFVEILRSSPTGLMDRNSFRDAAVARGVNANTFSVFTTYSSILDHPALNVWCLRGRQYDPVDLEALKAILSTRTRTRRTISYGWTDDGAITFTARVPDVNSPVLGIPTAVGRYLLDRRFVAQTRDGAEVGTVVVDGSAASWGYGPFLRRMGAEPLDVLTVEFDLATQTATLTLATESALEEE